MRILVTGSTGYIGGRLVPRLLDAGHEVHVIARDPDRIGGRPWSDSVRVHAGDLMNPQTLVEPCREIDVAFYLVHSMSAEGDFEERDGTAARNFGAAAAGIGHVIYLGGLQPGTEDASKHLRSRAEVGAILAEALPTTEFRAGPIIGSGSASFELVRYLTERLPIMITPKWVDNEVQPIGVRDILAYLIAAIDRGPSGIVEVGTDPISFRQMMKGYAASRGLRRTIIPLPLLTPRLASHWVGLVTPIPRRLARPLIEGIIHPLYADRTRARLLFPDISPMPYAEAVALALLRSDEGLIETRWSGSMGGGAEFELEEKEGLIREIRTIIVDATPADVFSVVAAAGGVSGWFGWDALWKIRGAIDRVVGGPGLRRGRRHPSELLIGEAVDFWRVEEVRSAALVRLRAEMKLPGRAWLQWEMRECDDTTKTELKQTAIYAPRGLWGMLYWWASYPFHLFIFRDMAREIARRAEKRAAHRLSSAPAQAV